MTSKSFAALALALMAMAACGKAPEAGRAEQSASLDEQMQEQIRGWRTSLLKTAPACANAPADKACRAFEVACKGSLPLTPEDTAKGITAKVVAAITYEEWDAARSEFHSASAFARFDQAGGAWTRSQTAPVNLVTCAKS